jgi:hypothetical protein
MKLGTPTCRQFYVHELSGHAYLQFAKFKTSNQLPWCGFAKILHSLSTMDYGRASVEQLWMIHSITASLFPHQAIVTVLMLHFKHRSGETLCRN